MLNRDDYSLVGKIELELDIVGTGSRVVCKRGTSSPVIIKKYRVVVVSFCGQVKTSR